MKRFLIKLVFGQPKKATSYNASIMTKQPTFKTISSNLYIDYWYWVKALRVSLMHPKTNVC